MMEKFREELLRTDIIPRKLNDVSKKYRELFLKDIESGKIKTEEVTKCQCGSTNLERLTKIDRFGLPFGSLICKDCGLVITSPRIIDESLPYYYDKYYHPLNYGKEHLENQAVLFAEGQGVKIFNILKKYIVKQKKLKVLEIGAGTGNVLSEFKSEASKNNIIVEELGTEYSYDCINSCSQRGINVIYGNISTVVEKKEKFDVIILSHVFEHFIDLKSELDKLKDIMNEDTLLYIEVPGLMMSHTKDYYDFSFLGYLVHAHMYNFTKDSLLGLLDSEGFKEVSSNENIEAVFKLKKDNDSEYINSSDNYNKIMNYLEQFYLSYTFLKEAIDSIINKQNIKIETRDKEIVKYKETIEKQNIKIETRDKEIAKYKEIIEKQNIKIETRDKEIAKYKEIIEKQNIKIAIINDELQEIKDKVNSYFNLSLFNKIKNYKKIRGDFCEGKS